MVIAQSNVNPAVHLAATTFHRRHHHHHLHFVFPRTTAFRRLTLESAKVKAFSNDNTQSDDIENLPNKPPACTADELHYVTVNKSDWRLALWRYKPSPQARRRNHPLLLLSGVGMNAITYDLSPGSSFARYMCGQGFDTWILEVRGAGLSTQGSDRKDVEKSERLSGSQSKIVSAEFFDQIAKLLDDSFVFERFSEVRKKILSLLETGQNSGFASQSRELSRKLVDIIEEAQHSVSPLLFDLREHLKKQLDLIAKYDWDFDHYLEEDVPAAMDYIKGQTEPKDGRILAVGYSMGGILLYALLSRYSSEGRDPGLASVVTLASSLDYTTSESSLKLLLPLADPIQALNVPVVPLGLFFSAAYPLSSLPPYVLSWMNDLISAQDMMPPELLKKIFRNNFCTIPAKLLLQLSTAFREGGLRDRRGTFFYKDHLRKSNVPVLALAGDRDLICPPDAVYETVKLIPKHLVTYKVFGEPNGTHYAHYDVVAARLAVEQIYPCIVQFLTRHDLDQ